MRLQWGPSPGQPDGRHQEARDEATGITAVVECDDPSGPEPWTWYLANYPVVSREPADDEGPAGRAPSREAAMAAAELALPTPDESAGLLRREKAQEGIFAHAGGPPDESAGLLRREKEVYESEQ